MPITPDQRKIRELKKHLRNLVESVDKATAALDTVMKGPSTPSRGQSVAKITNFIELNCDLARRFGLGVNSKKRTK